MQSQGGRSSFWTPEPPGSRISRLGGRGSPAGLTLSTPPPRKKCQSVETTHGEAAQNAASNSPCPTVAPTFQRLTPRSNLFATGSSPKSPKHVVMSPLHSQRACQLMDDHPKEAKDAYLRRESQARNQGQGESELTGIKRFANSECRQNALGVTPLGEHSPCPERWGIRRAQQRALKRQLQQQPECEEVQRSPFNNFKKFKDSFHKNFPQMNRHREYFKTMKSQLVVASFPKCNRDHSQARPLGTEGLAPSSHTSS